jgi:hypothetical protein
MHYQNPDAMQPTCGGVDENGELIWMVVPKARWHQAMFPVRYLGNFTEQWMFLIMKEKGIDWDIFDHLREMEAA